MKAAPTGDGGACSWDWLSYPLRWTLFLSFLLVKVRFLGRLKGRGGFEWGSGGGGRAGEVRTLEGRGLAHFSLLCLSAGVGPWGSLLPPGAGRARLR